LNFNTAFRALSLKSGGISPDKTLFRVFERLKAEVTDAGVLNPQTLGVGSDRKASP